MLWSLSAALSLAALAPPPTATLRLVYTAEEGSRREHEGFSLSLKDCAERRPLGPLVVDLRGAEGWGVSAPLRAALWLQRDDRACARGPGDGGLLVDRRIVGGPSRLTGIRVPSPALPLLAATDEAHALTAGALLTHGGIDSCQRRHARAAERWRICMAVGPEDEPLERSASFVVGHHDFWAGTLPPPPPTWGDLLPGHLRVHGVARASTVAGPAAAAMEIFWRPSAAAGDACRLWAGQEPPMEGVGALEVDLSPARPLEVPEAAFTVPLDPDATFAFCARQRDRAGNVSSWAAPWVHARSERAVGLMSLLEPHLQVGHGCAAGPGAAAGLLGAALAWLGRRRARRQPRRRPLG